MNQTAALLSLVRWLATAPPDDAPKVIFVSFEDGHMDVEIDHPRGLPINQSDVTIEEGPKCDLHLMEAAWGGVWWTVPAGNPTASKK